MYIVYMLLGCVIDGGDLQQVEPNNINSQLFNLRWVEL